VSRARIIGCLASALALPCCHSANDGLDTTKLVTVDASVDADDAAVVGQPYGGTWTPLAAPPPFSPGEMALLTDGTVIVHESSTSDWWRLTPDNFGSYVNGSWSPIAAFPYGYSPTFFGLAVLPNGSVVAMGGEYNLGAYAWTSLGAMYDPLADAWTPIAPPPSWTINTIGIGDTPTVVLPNGVLMIANAANKEQALFDARTLTFTITGAGKYDNNDEEGWTLLPNGKVLTIDVGKPPRAELYDWTKGSWSSAGMTPVPLSDTSSEIGPAIVRPNGSVFAMGATGNNAIYGSDGTWTTGPSFIIDPDGGQLDIADGPAALLTNGNILCAASPGVFHGPVTFFEFDGTNLTPLPATANAAKETSFNFMFLPLPSGEILEVDGSQDAEVFTPNGSPDPSWAPAITNAPSNVTRGSTNLLTGTQLNGLSQACGYGDDYQCATNYPLVRLTNVATGHVVYARTHDHSTMAIATGSAQVSTLFNVPQNAETGASTLVVVANGIASAPAQVNVQ
jgi:hypothetical protein